MGKWGLSIRWLSSAERASCGQICWQREGVPPNGRNGKRIPERSPVLLRHAWWHQATIRVWVLALLWKPSANQLNYFITTCKLWRSNTPCAINSLGPYSGTWYSIMYPQRGCWQVETSIHNSRGRRLCSQLLPVPSLGVGKFLLAFHIMHHQCCCPEAKSLPTQHNSNIQLELDRVKSCFVDATFRGNRVGLFQISECPKYSCRSDEDVSSSSTFQVPTGVCHEFPKWSNHFGLCSLIPVRVLSNWSYHHTPLVLLTTA